MAQAERFGVARSNVDFREGRFEDLAALGIADASVDVVISDCAINLSPSKERVCAEIFRVLKPGGELYFSDAFAGRRQTSPTDRFCSASASPARCMSRTFAACCSGRP